MKTVVIATNNGHKLAEFRRIFSKDSCNEYRVLSLADVGFVGDIEENADTFEGNALLKAKTVSEFCGYCAIADDSGLEVECLGGAPGVYSARYAGEGATSEQLIEKLLCEMASTGCDNRNAQFVSVMCAYFPGGKSVFAEGVCKGKILTSPSGDNGFGYDPIFHYAPFGKSFAEMSNDEKNSISHRAVATENLLEKLKTVSNDAFLILNTK